MTPQFIYYTAASFGVIGAALLALVRMVIRDENAKSEKRLIDLLDERYVTREEFFGRPRPLCIRHRES